MIALLEGTIERKSPQNAILNVNGVGYEINISASTYERLPGKGGGTKLHIIETVGIYGGGVTLYGFYTQEEKDIFLCFKEGLKNTGAKKSLDYTDKAMKSLPDFRKAVLTKNMSLLTSIFGFRKPTAEKIITLLQKKMEGIDLKGGEKWPGIGEGASLEAIQALISLGYRETQAKEAVQKVMSGADEEIKTQDIIKNALKYLS